MEVLQNNSIHKVNRLAIVSLAAGVLSLLPYLPAVSAILLHAISGSDALLETATIIPVTVYALVGILFGTISVIVSESALEQIKSSESVEKGHSMATTGRILGILGAIMNVFFGILFVLLFRISL